MAQIRFGELTDIRRDQDAWRVGGRCWSGTLRVGDTFTEVRSRRGTAAARLIVKSIELYGSPVDELETGLTAWITLSGDGGELLVEDAEIATSPS